MQGTLCHFPNYNEFLEKSKLYVFPKSGENCLCYQNIFLKKPKKQKKTRNYPLSMGEKRGIV